MARQLIFILLFTSITFNGIGQTVKTNKMAFVNGGSFMMGINSSTIDSLAKVYDVPKDFIESEYPKHKVKISSFYIDQYEVTNAEFKEFIDKNPEWQKGNVPDSLHNGHYLEHWDGNNYPAGEEYYPVYNVSWYAAVAYSQWQNKRLPTEAEWEYAAGCKGKFKNYPWGDSKPDNSKCNYNNQLGKAIEVGSYPPNNIGIYDMSGNVWEYTLDEWSATYYKNSPDNNPLNGAKYFTKETLFAIKSRRVIRGGSWGGSELNLRISFRDSHPVTGAANHVGFRCVKDITRVQK